MDENQNVNPDEQQELNNDKEQEKINDDVGIKSDTMPKEIANVKAEEQDAALTPKNKISKGSVAGTVIISLIFIALIASFIFLAKQDENKQNGNKSEVETSYSANVTVQTSAMPDTADGIVTFPKPDIEEKYLDNDGRYTPQGLAKVVSPSVVGVVVYRENQRLIPSGEGSGIIISADGYIVTNAHVVSDASAQKIVLNNQEEFKAKLVGLDTKTDIAVLKVDDDYEFIPAQLGSSAELELGEQVMAIGNPGGLSGSISGGFISGLNRNFQTSNSGEKMNFIQTDAAVNPGNSGGPLVNMYGQVVGVISSKYVDINYEGIGFAIPIDEALPIIKNIMSLGYVPGRIRIGITYRAVSQYEAEWNHVVPGLYIFEIDPSCDIANTDLRAGDIITEINGMAINNSDDIEKSLEGKKVGDIVTAKVYRTESTKNQVSTFTISFKLVEDTVGR